MTEYYSRLQYTAVHHTTVGKDAKQRNRINIVTTNTHLQSSTKTKLRGYLPSLLHKQEIYDVTITSDLTKVAMLSVAHFAALHSDIECEDMVFLHSTDRSPPYYFYPVPGGKFLPHGALGTITVNTFSKWAIGKRKRTDRHKSAPLALKWHHKEGKWKQTGSDQSTKQPKC